MKIHNTTPKQLVRVAIKKHKEKTMYLNFDNCTHKSAVDELTMYVNSLNIPITTKGLTTTLIVREYKDSKNGVSQSIPLRGVNVLDMFNLLSEKFSF